MQYDKHIEIDVQYLVSDLNAALSLRNYDSQSLQLFELRTPFLVLVSKSDDEKSVYQFHQFSFDANYCHIVGEQELNLFRKRPLHQHSFVEIMFVLDGEVINTTEGNTYTYHPGDCVIMNRNIRHREDGVFQAVFFDFQDDFIRDLIEEETAAFRNVPEKYTRFLESGLIKMLQEANQKDSQIRKNYFDCLPVIPQERILQEIYPLLNSLIRELCSGDPGSVSMVHGYFLKLLKLLCDPQMYYVSSISSTLSKKDFLAEKVCHILESRHGRVFSSTLSDMLHYNKEYLNRIVKERTGKTISQYRQMIVLWEARRLLEETDLSISEIMAQLELSNRSFFYSMFRKEYGITPAEYRKQSHKYR